MIVDFFRHGTGLSKGCLDYMLGEDREREHALVLNGDVELTAQLIDSSPYTKKYTSGCLSFYEHDLTEPDKQKIMQDFERCLFPGLEQDQYKILWVEHRDKLNQDKVDPNKLPTDEKELDQKRRLELNFVIPNVELSTGKRLQPFYAPVDLDRVDLFKKITNKKYRLYDPDAPEHRQLLLDKKHLPSNVKDFKSQLHGHIYRAVVDGDITDRQTLVQWLESHQIKVTRQVKQSISIENPFNDAKRPIRLEGEIYEQGFTATGEYRQEVQRRIKAYRGTARKRYRTDFRSYQKQLKHKSQYHRERYSGIGQKDRSEPSTELGCDRQQADRAPSLARVEIEPFTATQRADRERSTESPQQGSREEAEPFKYHADFNGCYFSYLNFIADLDRKRKVQRDRGFEQRDISPTSQSRPLEQFGWESEHQDMQTEQQPIQPPMYFDQRKTGQIREWLLHSNGVLTDDRIRNTAIEDHRRTTAAITATTSAIEKATSGFGIDARRYYESLVGAVTSNQIRSKQLAAGTKIISDNTATVSRSREEYSKLYRADQWESSRDKPDYSQQRERIRENIECATRNIDTIRERTAELARNFRSIEANIVQMKERPQKKMHMPQPKKHRGMDMGM